MAFEPDTIVFHEYGTPEKHEDGTPFQLSKTAKNPYHILVYPDGSVRYYHGKKNKYGGKAAHVYERNSQAIGISYAGPVGSTPTPAAMKTLERESAEAAQFIKSRGVENVHVMGHGEAYQYYRGSGLEASKSGRSVNEGVWYKNFVGYTPGRSYPGSTAPARPGTYAPGPVKPELTPPEPAQGLRERLDEKYLGPDPEAPPAPEQAPLTPPEPIPATPRGPEEVPYEGHAPDSAPTPEPAGPPEPPASSLDAQRPAEEGTTQNTTVPSNLVFDNDTYDFEGGQPNKPRYVVPFQSNIPAYPTTVEQSENMHKFRREQVPSQDYSWWDMGEAMGSNALYGSAVTIGRNMINGAIDPDFKVTPEDLKDVSPDHYDWVSNAPNREEFEARKERLKFLERTGETISKMGWPMYIAFEGANLALEAPFWIAVGAVSPSIPFMAKWAQLSRRGQFVRYATTSAIATAPEMGLYYGVGETNAAGVVYGTLAGGLLGGGVGAVTSKRGYAANRLVKEAETASHKKMEEAGTLPAQAPKTDAATEAEIYGDYTGPELITRGDKTIRRTQEQAPGYAQQRAAQDWDTITAEMPSTSTKRSKEATEAIQRQAYQGDAGMTIYVPLKKNGQLADFGYKNAVASPHKRLAEVKVPPSALRVDLSDGTLGDPAGPIVYLTDGLFKKARKPKDAVTQGVNEILRDGHSYVPNTAKKGYTTAARIVKKQTSEDADWKTMEEADKALREGTSIEDWMRQQALEGGPGAGSGGAARPQLLDDLQANPNAKPAISDTSIAVQRVLRDDSLAPERDGWWSRKFMISRGNAMAHSDNPVVRRAARLMFPGLANMNTEMLEKFGRPRTVMEIREELANNWTSAINDAERIATREFDKDYKSDPAKFVRLYAQLVDDKFNGKKLWPYERAQLVNAMTTRAMRQKMEHGSMDPMTPDYIKANADSLDQVGQDILEHMADPGRAVGESGEWMSITGADEVLAALRANGKTHWLPRSWNWERINKWNEFFGTGDVLEQFLFKNISQRLMRDDLGHKFTVDHVKAISRAMADSIVMGKGGYNSWMESAVGRAGSEELVSMLRDYNKRQNNPNLKVSNAVLQDIEDYMLGKAPGDRNASGRHLISRGILDETGPVGMAINGKTKTMHLSDFVENNASVLMKDYAMKMAGRTANATLRDSVPGVGRAAPRYLIGGHKRELDDQGNLVKEWKYGIRNDRDFDNFMQKVGEAKVGSSTTDSFSDDIWNDENMLQNWYKIQTHTYPSSKLDQILATSRMINNIRYLGNAMFPQLGESVNVFAHGGAHVARRLFSKTQFLENMKNFKTPSDAAEIAPLTRMITRMGVYGHEFRNMMVGTNRQAEAGIEGTMATTHLGRAQFHIERMEDFVLTYGGLLPATSWQTIRTIEGLIDQTYHWAAKHSSYDRLPARHKNWLLNAGLSKDDINNVFKILKDPQRTTVSKDAWGSQVKDIIVDPDFDPVMRRFTTAMKRQATTAIQHNKWDQMPPGWDLPIMKQVFQLMSFMVGSFSAQMVNNTRRGAQAVKSFRAGKSDLSDLGMEMGAVATMTVGQIASGAAMALLLLKLRSLGNSEEYNQQVWDDETELDNLMAMGIARSGFFATVPFMYDTVAGGLFNQPGFSGYRSSGLGMGLLDNPTAGTAKDLIKAGKASYDLITGEGDSDDFQKISRVMTNFWAMDALAQFAGRAMVDEKDFKARRDNPFTPILGND